MSSFKPLQPKRALLSTPAAPTSSLLPPSRPLVPTSPPASEPVAPLTQEQLERAAQLGHSLERISIFPPEKKNSTGLPDTLKAGIEKLSRLSLDDVHVHYSSSKPAQLQALAHTQGTEIHVGPGQEQHLAHEAWHVVQQKQGRVEPTLQAKGVRINDDEGLEHEADVMGGKADAIIQRQPSSGCNAIQMYRPKRNQAGLDFVVNIGNLSDVIAVYQGRSADGINYSFLYKGALYDIPEQDIIGRKFAQARYRPY